MSFVRFKKIEQIRNQRDDFTAIIPQMKQFGLQQAKRKKEDDIATTTTTTTTTTGSSNQNTPVKRPRKEDDDDKHLLPESSDDEEENRPLDAFDLKPYPESGTIRSTTITSLIYKSNNFTSKAFCWKVEDYKEKRKATFTNLTRMFFFPGGNIFEDDVLDKVDEELGITMARQYQQGGKPDNYEEDAVIRMRQNRFTYRERHDGFTNQISDDLTLWGRKIICRADGYTDDHVVEVKVPFGSLYKVYQSGFIEYEDDGVKKKRFDPEQEVFSIPPHYMCQLLFEMNTFKKKKAYFGQYYSFRNWVSLFNHLILQYNQAMEQVPFQDGFVIYRPRLDKTLPINTIMKRAIKIIQETYTDTDNAAAKKVKRQQAANYMRQFWTEYCGLPEIPEEIETASADDQENYIERNWKEYLDKIIENTTKANLMQFGFSAFQSQEIEKVFTVGKGDDIQRGIVKPRNKVLWDGANEKEDFPPWDEFIAGLKMMMKKVIARCSRKNKSKWNAFEHALTRENVVNMELYPRNDQSYDEFVLMEVDLTDTYDEAMRHVRKFLRDLERIDQHVINCKGVAASRKAGKLWMMGKGGIRDEFIDYLKSIPVQKIAHKKYPIYTWTMMRY